MSKPTVWVFGDSFSEEVTCLPKDTARWDYVNKVLNGIPYKTWMKLISEKLNYNYENYAAFGGYQFDVLGNGNSNDQMFYNITESSTLFKKGDIVFVGFTQIGRYQIYKHDINQPSNVLPDQDLGPNTEFYIKHYVDRNCQYYANEIMQKFKILETLSELVGFKIFYWDWSDSIYENEPNINPKNWLIYELFGEWLSISEIFRRINKDIKDITTESGGLVRDSHWGKWNNEILGDLFYEHIKNVI